MMVKVNVLYDEDFDDADIIVVPKNIANNIENITQKFFNWITEPDNKKLFEKVNSSGKVYVSITTKDFIWWLNKYVLFSGPSATIIEEHTKLRPEYPTTLF